MLRYEMDHFRALNEVGIVAKILCRRMKASADYVIWGFALST
jgi:hypothetical protein